jgi:uncharacterized protein YcbK (DUF882 family)
MKLTKNFSLSEFACHDGTPVPESKIDNVKALANNLQVIRDELGAPLQILSGYRTPTWNTKVGGAAKSMHKEAKAADLTTKGLSPRQLHAKIASLIKAGKIADGGLGLYRGFVHYDIGAVRRWNG